MKLKIVFFTLLLCGVFQHANASSEKITFAYENREQYPYYLGYTTKIPSKPGIAVEMVMLLEKKISSISIKINLIRRPWKRCLYLLQRGEVDGIFKATFKPERMNFGSFPMKNGQIDTSKNMVMISNSLYTVRGSENIWDGTISSLKVSVSAPRGYSIVDYLKKRGVTVIESNNSYNCLQKLSVNRISAAAIQDIKGDAWLKKVPVKFKEIVKLSPPLTTQLQYLMLSHNFVDKKPELSKTIWNMIEIIRETEFDSIALRYIK